MKSRGNSKFVNIFFIMANHRQYKSKDSVKLIWMEAESKLMNGCFYYEKCKNCNKFLEFENECKGKGLLSFNRDIKKL